MDRFAAESRRDGSFFQSSSSLGTAETVSYKSALLLDSMFAGGEKHRITGLVEHRREQFSFDSIFLFGPDLDAARNGRTRTSTGVAGEYVLDLLATGTTVSAAVRQDFNDPFKDELTWRFSLSQKVAPIGGRLHTSVGRGVTNPSFIEQFGFLTSTFVPNPALVPESSIGWDVGWEQTFWDGRVVVDVTYFNSRLEHEIVFVSLPSFKSSVRNLDGTSTRQGVETTGKFRPFDWLTLAATYTYTDARDDKGSRKSAGRCMRHRGQPRCCSIRTGQGDRQRHLQWQDDRHDLHLPVLDHHAQCLHAGWRANLLRHDPVVDDLHPGRKRVQSALRGSVLVSLARRRGLCGREGAHELKSWRMKPARSPAVSSGLPAVWNRAITAS